MSLRGLDSSKSYSEGSETYYGKTIDDIKFKYRYNRGYIYIKKEVWVSITNSFDLSYDEVSELTMWAIGDEPNLKGVLHRALIII